MNKEPWYSVRCVFKHQRRVDMEKRNLYEERITIWNTDSFDKAIELAEEEAKSYAKDTDSVFVGLSQGYHLYETEIINGSEIFSLMREHNYSPKTYLDRYFDTGQERTQNNDDE